MAAAQGAQAKMGMHPSSTTVNEPYEFKSETIQLIDYHYDPDGITGTRDYHSERVRQNITHIEGGIQMEPNSSELANLLPRILGAAAVGTTYDLAETLPSSVISVDRVAKVFVYQGMVVDRATFKASQGGPLSLDLSYKGVSETKNNAGTFPALVINTANGGPFILSDLAITVGGVTYQFFDFELTLDNMLELRHLNSLTPTSITPRSRKIDVGLSSPWGDNSALYTANLPGSAVVATFTNGAMSLMFTMPAVAFPRQTPTVPGKTEIKHSLRGTARKSGSTPSLSITLDSTP